MAAHALFSTSVLRARDTTAVGDKPHDNLGPQFNVAIWFLTGLAAIFLGMRMYCKRIRRRKLWWDDYVLIAAWLALVVQTSLLSVMVGYGFGRHSWDIKDWYHWLLLAYPTGVFSVTAAAWSKTSFAITLLRFTGGWSRKFVWFIIVTVNLFLGCSGLFSYIQCWPIQQLWDSTVRGTCWPGYVIVNFNTFSSSWSGAMDIVLAIMPWWVINRRSLNKRERLGVLLAMSLGVFAGATSIAKTATLFAIKDPDAISSVSLMILATAETAITIIAASIPILRALIMAKRHESPPNFCQYSPEQGLSPSKERSDHKLVSLESGSSSLPRMGSQMSGRLSGPSVDGVMQKALLRDRGDSWLSSTSEMELALRSERQMSQD